MKVLSLFDGIGCGAVALERAGINVSRYISYEIDPLAIKVCTRHHSHVEHQGSVIGADFSEFKGFDLVIGGFPCQDLSTAGKHAGLSGPQSSLFWELVRAIQTACPKYFLVENNVGMPDEAKRIITRELGVEPVAINSSLVSAQRRNRLYWTNIPGIGQPEDRGVLLHHILESGIGVHGDKSMALTASYAGAVLWNSLERHQRTMVAERVAPLPESVNCEYHDLPPSLFIVRAGETKLTKGGKAGPSSKTYKINIPDGVYTARKFTPTECEALQGLPKYYTVCVANTHRYRLLGNGWNVDTIVHILNHIKDNR